MTIPKVFYVLLGTIVVGMVLWVFVAAVLVAKSL